MPGPEYVDPMVDDVTDEPVDDTDAVDEDEDDGLGDELPEQDIPIVDRPAVIPDDEADGFDKPDVLVARPTISGGLWGGV